MYFQQFYLTCLSHASYLLGSEGIACVVDPQRDVSIYIEEARAQGLEIQHIIETHLHADFVSGHVELAARTGAKIYLGAAADSPLQHVAVLDGNEIRFGRLILRFLETPGHTLESVSVVVTDLDRGEKAWAVLTGDTLFIGDVGRPDLSGDKTPQELAAMLYDSLHQKLEPLAGQFAGSAAALLGLAHSILIAEDQAAVEESRTRLARVGFEGVAGYLEGGMPRWAAEQMPSAQIMQITAAELQRVLDQEPGAIQIVDVRRKPEWDHGHITGALHKPLDRVATMLGDLDRAKPVVVHCKGGYRSAIACSLIQQAGFENVTNLIGGLDAWQVTGLAVSA